MTTIAFPDHDLDPRKKDKKWILQFAKAAWNNFQMGMPVGSIFYSKANRYDEIRSYAMGKQSTDKYKKELLPEESQDDSYSKISWDPRTDGAVIRNIAVAKIQKAGYNIICTPINADAQDAEDASNAALKAKIMLREAAQKQDPSIAESPQLKQLPGEPEDLQELQMQIDFNPKLVRAKDVEESVQLVLYENEFDKAMDAVAEDLVDFGVGILKEDIDENNKVVLRKVMPGRFICSYTDFSDFRDVYFAGEVNMVKLSALAKVFDEDKVKEIQDKVAGRDGNPSNFGENTLNNNGYDIFKAAVLDLEFITYDKRVTEHNTDDNGNLRISKTNPKNADKDQPKYNAKTIEYVYKCKWVVGTDLLYDYGKADNQKRSVDISTMSKTKMSYHIVAASFHKMKAKGLTEELIPIIDDICRVTYKWRNCLNQMVPNGFDVDIAALENVAMGKGGENMKPKEILDMFFETGIMVSRRSGISMDTNVNYKAIQPIQNDMSDQLKTLMDMVQVSKQALRDITGLNELTDGSTPNPKTLTTIANLANESTNNALYYLVNARTKLLEATAKGVVQRLQIAVKNGPYDGFNKEAGRFITVPKSIADYDYDLMIEDAPTDEQKQIIYSLMTDDIKQGLISHADVIGVIYTKNLKHAAILLSYKVEKNKKAMQEQTLQNTNATAQAQMQSNQAAETVKDQMAEKAHQRKMQELDLIKSWEYETQKLKNQQLDANADKKAITEIMKSDVDMSQMPQQGQPQDPSQQMQQPQQGQQEQPQQPPMAQAQQ